MFKTRLTYKVLFLLVSALCANAASAETNPQKSKSSKSIPSTNGEITEEDLAICHLSLTAFNEGKPTFTGTENEDVNMTARYVQMLLIEGVRNNIFTVDDFGDIDSNLKRKIIANKKLAYSECKKKLAPHMQKNVEFNRRYIQKIEDPQAPYLIRSKYLNSQMTYKNIVSCIATFHVLDGRSSEKNLSSRDMQFLKDYNNEAQSIAITLGDLFDKEFNYTWYGYQMVFLDEKSSAEAKSIDSNLKHLESCKQRLDDVVKENFEKIAKIDKSSEEFNNGLCVGMMSAHTSKFGKMNGWWAGERIFRNSEKNIQSASNCLEYTNPSKFYICTKDQSQRERNFTIGVRAGVNGILEKLRNTDQKNQNIPLALMINATCSNEIEKKRALGQP